MKFDPVKDGARALSDLNTFAAVVTVLEGGHIMCSASQPAVKRIVTICKREQQKLLREYDAARARAK